jgi:hypothetical protein
MKNTSLEKATELIFEAIDKSDINIIDKFELLLNLKYFLDKERYKDNIKTLSRRNSKWKKY